jgi:hypothetical protein
VVSHAQFVFQITGIRVFGVMDKYHLITKGKWFLKKEILGLKFKPKIIEKPAMQIDNFLFPHVFKTDEFGK